MASGFITSHETFKYVKYHTRGNYRKGFVQALSHYVWEISWECKVQAWLHYYKPTTIWKWDIRVTSIEDTELQVRVITSGHYLPCGVKGRWLG